jgi:hypothetical protein
MAFLKDIGGSQEGEFNYVMKGLPFDRKFLRIFVWNLKISIRQQKIRLIKKAKNVPLSVAIFV